MYSLDDVDLIRCGSKEYIEPWNFSNKGEGRFDLVGKPPAGTCYFASDLTGAIREVIGPEFDEGKFIFTAFVTNFVYWIVAKSSENFGDATADLQNDLWNAIGLTSEIFTVTDYAICQKWAGQFWAGGHTGLKVGLRHLLSPKRFGIALFGNSGVKPDDSKFFCKSRSEITTAESETILKDLGFRVLASIPNSEDYKFLA